MLRTKTLIDDKEGGRKINQGNFHVLEVRKYGIQKNEMFLEEASIRQAEALSTPQWKWCWAVDHTGEGSGERSLQHGHLTTQRPTENMGVCQFPQEIQRVNLGKNPRKYILIEVQGILFMLFLPLRIAVLQVWSGDPWVSFEGL